MNPSVNEAIHRKDDRRTPPLSVLQIPSGTNRYSPESDVDLRRPIELGNFCLVNGRNYVHGCSRMTYLVEPSNSDDLNWDLNVAFDQRTPKKHSSDEKLDNLLHWICDNVEKFRAPCDGSDRLSSLRTDFVCYRGLLTTIMVSLYERNEGWELGATLYRGTRYLCQYPTPEHIAREENQTDFMKRASAWGYKFEQYLTASQPGGRPTPEQPLDEREEFCTVARTRLGERHSLVYGAEVDAVDDDLVKEQPQLKTSTQRYVEMKTSRSLQSHRQEQNLARFKMVKWWAQSYLIGIPRVICGFRDDDGFVESIRSFPLADLVEEGKNYWSPKRMLAFLDEFLNFVRANVVNDDPNEVVLFQFDPHKRLIHCSRVNHDNFKKILPEWYLTKMKDVIQDERSTCVKSK